MHGNNDIWSEKSIVHVSLDSDLGLVKFEVDLDSLPIQESPYDGFEVVVQFHVNDFDNN